MDVLTSETCWALNNEIKKQVTSSRSLFIQVHFIFSITFYSPALEMAVVTFCTVLHVYDFIFYTLFLRSALWGEGIWQEILGNVLWHVTSKEWIRLQWLWIQKLALFYCAVTSQKCLSQYLTNLMHKICFTLSFISCLYMFRAHVLIIRRSKLHYTASGIITPIGRGMK